MSGAPLYLVDIREQMDAMQVIMRSPGPVGICAPQTLPPAQKAVRTPGTVPRPGGYDTSARPPRPLFHHPRKTAAGSRVGGTGLVSGGAVARGKAVCSDERGQRSQVQSAVGRWRVGCLEY